MPEIMSLAAGAARHAAQRQATLATNVANADTPGFKARDLAAFDPDDGFALRRTHAAHFGVGSTQLQAAVLRDLPADPNGNSVDLEDQVLRGIEAARRHDRAITVYRNALDLMRASLGRR
ncbi:flagellar basal body protein [Jannaschia seosinensis]|nr:flagellar basal body protein [Jannaschia seosinensis]